MSEPPKEAAVVDPFAEDSEEETKVRKKKEKKQAPAPQGIVEQFFIIDHLHEYRESDYCNRHCIVKLF